VIELHRIVSSLKPASDVQLRISLFLGDTFRNVTCVVLQMNEDVSNCRVAFFC